MTSALLRMFFKLKPPETDMALPIIIPGLSNEYFVRFLLFLLFLILIFIAVRKVPAFKSKKGVPLIISVALSLMASRYLSEEMIQNYILRPYANLTLLILFGGVFLILFFFLHKSNFTGVGRKVIWLCYGIILGVVWFNNNSFPSYGPTRITLFIWAGLIVTMILLDKPINSIFRKIKMKSYAKLAN